MPAVGDFKGILILVPDPVEAGGQAYNDNFKELANRTGPVFFGSGEPTVAYDSDDSAGVGVQFHDFSMVVLRIPRTVFMCVDDTPGAAVWVELTGNLNKTVFFPANLQTGTDQGSHRIVAQKKNESITYGFSVPEDFGALVSLEMIGIPSVGAAAAAQNIDLFSDYGAIGEDITEHSEAEITTAYDFTGLALKFAVIDVSVVFNSLAAGDICGLTIDHKNIGGTIGYKGIKLVYKPLGAVI